jgi:hypothetical protein
LAPFWFFWKALLSIPSSSGHFAGDINQGSESNLTDNIRNQSSREITPKEHPLIDRKHTLYIIKINSLPEQTDCHKLQPNPSKTILGESDGRKKATIPAG